MSGTTRKRAGGTGVRGVLAAGLTLIAAAVAGCSGGTSRFDYPMFASNSGAGEADYMATSSLQPVPSEPVYVNSPQSANRSANRTTVTRQDLPPPSSTQGQRRNTQYASANGQRTDAYPRQVQSMPSPAQQGQQQARWQGEQQQGWQEQQQQDRWQDEQQQQWQPPYPSARDAKTQAKLQIGQQPDLQPEPQPEPQPQQAAEPEPAGEPADTDVTVSRGDTLYGLSKRYGVSVQAIMTANDMRNSRLSIGDTLTIPGDEGATVTKSTYTVQRGDSMARIARRHGIEPQMLARYNDISRPSIIQPGQVLKIPGAPGESQSKEVADSRNESKNKGEPVRVASKDASVPVPGSRPEKKSEKRSGKKSGQKVASRKEAVPSPEPMSGNQFRWPVRGRIIANFGPKENGLHNDGINVSVPKGASVKAVENGVVAYAGSELQPYGNLILIRHADDWVSAYAHNDELLVKRGDTVRRGQVISKAGQSGSVSQPQLHFELRKGSQPVDPLQYMASS